jgi:hypothetical protein
MSSLLIAGDLDRVEIDRGMGLRLWSGSRIRICHRKLISFDVEVVLMPMDWIKENLNVPCVSVGVGHRGYGRKNVAGGTFGRHRVMS